MITQEFDLNLIPNSDPVVVHVDQYDRGTGRLIISLFNGNEPYIPDGTAVIQGSKPDGRGFEYPADLEDNVVTANLTEQMTAVAGEVRTQIVVTEASGRTGTFAFTLAVQASALPSDTDMSASEYTVIQQAIEDSEAWARGSRGGVDVPVGDETYHNNSKYYADLAAQSAGQGGHVIVDGEGNEMPARPKLQFENSTVTDDALNNKTIVSTGTASGGSIVKVHTTESTLFGESVTLTDGVQTMTQTFDSNGDATFNAVMMIGNLTVESTDGTLIAVQHFTANYFGVYGVTLTFWTATIEVSTTTSAFDTLTVRAVKDGTTYGSGTFDNGTATVTVPETGEYTLVVDYLWAQYTATVNVIAETTYTTSVNGFFATVNLVTSTPEFANLPIYVTWDGDPVTGTAFSSGTASFTALEPGSYVFSVNYGGETYTATLTVTTETTYNNIEIKMWVATLTISTTSQELYGNTVTVKKEGAVVATNTLDSVTGSCVVNVHETGTYTVEVTDTIYQYTYRENAVVSAETNYPVQIDTFNATLSLTTTSPELASSQITITKGAETIGTTTFVSSSASYVVHETGTYTCSCTYLGEEYSKDVPVSTQTTYPVAIDTGLKLSAWLEAADLDPSDYVDFAAVEADEKAVRKLMTIHDAVDYLATAKAGDELMTAVVTSNICAKWINLRDYALDTLYANTDIASAMDTADKYFYGEWVITDDTTTPVTWGPKGNVPVMTANDAPYGKASASSENTAASGQAYHAFNNNDSDWWTSAVNSKGDQWIEYEFPNPICLKKVKIYNAISGTGTITYLKSIQGTKDGTAVDTLYDTQTAISSTTAALTTNYAIETNEYYKKIRINTYNATYPSYITSMQFYGREMKDFAPAMTNATSPYGAVTESGHYSSFQGYMAFTKKPDASGSRNCWITNAAAPQWIQYSNNRAGFVPKVFYRENLYDGSNYWDYAYSLEASYNGGTSVVLGTYTGQQGNNKAFYEILNNNQPFDTCKITVTERTSTYAGFANVRFYGFDYSEYDWDVDNPRTYIYDHGIEFKELVLRARPNTNETTRASNHILIAKRNTDNDGAKYADVSTAAKINMDYDIMCSEGYYSGTGLSLCALSANLASGTNYIATTSSSSVKYDNPIILDVSSINGEYVPCAGGVYTSLYGTGYLYAMWFE